MSVPSRRQLPPLSKSRFLAGLQCAKRLYLDCYHPELADLVDKAQQVVFDTGNEIGELARELYPGGLLLGGERVRHDDAVRRTGKALSDPDAPAIYEAAFTFEGVRIRADVIVRAPGGVFDLVEVKSGTQVKEEHLWDVSIQHHVLEGCGIPIGQTSLAHLNKDYVYPGGDYDLRKLFQVDDVTDRVQQLQTEVLTALEAMRLMLRGAEPPDVKPRRQCSQPYDCPFHGHCHAEEPEHPVLQLPGARQELLDSLEAAGVEDIRAIPADFPGLNPLQLRVRNCVVNNWMFLDRNLPKTLKALEYPVHFLDFETFNPALPLYAGTRPYQVIPFQWSSHTVSGDGVVRHDEFLHSGNVDPREDFARSLLEALGESGSIVVYSGFEETRIRELATALPSLAGRLAPLVSGRMVDLLPLVRGHCYHPGFHGSFSLKSVLPALVPELGYDDLEIQDGGQASTAYAEMIGPYCGSERRDSLRKSLLAYCRRDTEAMVRLFQKLREGT